MTETGWPLIPRETLPPPVPVERRPHPRGVPGRPGGRQLSMFGAETTEPSPADLAGLLAGPGQLGRMGGTARVSVIVDDAWRVHVLVAELVSRGLAATWTPVTQDQDPLTVRPEPDPGDELVEEIPATPEEPPPPRFEVRTAYSRRLNALATAWPAAAAQLFLSGPRLRLWVAATGYPRPGGYRLGLDPAKDPLAVDAALVRAGLAGRVTDDGQGYVIVGRRRLTRLAELVGERPEAAPAEFWPGGAAA
ncbi:hypothetical protein GCM10010168_67210 [Actinoplanes ianthinogenes]|uniref:Uncharacterized protein n=1 Tax=Actinoplanes ianthinogenes TaxID=122358 RepID=A0ABN6CFL2_9ACTN|nr:hypothetical protein [Actinoplanes ianthinogenes]BCJ43918.1 hypothetical protein Aiant_45750 [Actinoplanes ianthinogenes]GGR39172.1 hypothetical protein GCM10010168_67210 [Actinoplanes ianthinogenes]